MPQSSVVRCTVSYQDLEGDARLIDGVILQCTKCGHETESFGTTQTSIKRCLALMREECPMGENNWYIEE